MGSGTSKSPQYGVWIGEERPGETRILRSPDVGDGEMITIPEEGLTTVWKFFENSVLKSGGNKFLGTRKMISKDKYGDYEWKTYKEIDILVREFAGGAAVLKLCPEIESTFNGNFKFLGMYSKNREEWIIGDLACHLNSVTIVTFYDTLGEFAIQYILEQTRLTSIVMESKSLKNILSLKRQNKVGDLSNVILLDIEDPTFFEECKNAGLNMYTFDDVLRAGRGVEISFTPCTPETIATFCYTSGTTGIPKGAMISHKSLIAESTAVNHSDVKARPDDVYLSYLPLAHSFERTLITILIYKGLTCGFYSGSPLRLMEDAQILKPTVFAGVPRVYQRVYEVILTKIQSLGFLKKVLVERAIRSKLEAFHKDGTLTHPIWDRLVFRQTQAALGNRVRIMVTGSAPIAPDMLEFLKICFACPILEGYGQTENCAGAAITYGFDNFIGHVGGPFVGCELKLIDVEELGYTSKDINPENNFPEPRGEICVRGPIVFSGYFNDQENTAKTLDKDGWLHTGDVGCILTYHGNALKIIDRVKNIFKLSQGEYIAPEKLENILIKSRYVAQIFVHGESLENYLIGIIYPKKEACIEFLASKGINATKEDVHKYFSNQELKFEIVKDMENLGRKSEFKGFEVIKKVYLTTEAFSVENNLLTPTMKLKRHEAKKYFSTQIRELYQQE